MNHRYLQSGKSFLLVALVSLFAFNAFAQKDSIYVYKDRSILFKEAVTKFDSITFVENSSKNALNIHFQNTIIFNRNVSEIDSVNFGSNVKMLPLVITGSVSEIGVNLAICSGSVLNDGGSNLSDYGVCWSTEPEPSIADSKTSNNEDSTGAFSNTISDLTPSTTYYIRTYATNEIGTAYGEIFTFTTLSGVATLTTRVITDISDISATSGGNITNEGGVSVTERGVCWSTEVDPTIEDNKIAQGSGRGSFTCNITDLSPSTTYYVRSYATNLAGTFYGETVSFTTEEALNGSNWMCRISSNTYLRNISIPGTHDSGATSGGNTSQCQDWDIETQLNNGVRFLDMRFRVSGERLRVYHGSVAMNLYHDEFFNTLRQFLSNHPSETVIISIRNENDGANDAEKLKFREILDDEINENSSKWFIGSTVPRLSEARGKMVLFRRYDSNKGINMFNNWGDNMTFDVSGGRVQDVYTITTTGFLSPNYDAKWNHISDLLGDASNDNGSKFFVNFCSASLIILASPKTVSNNINPRLQTFMDTAAKGSWGWILMDFPTEKLVTDIYMKNIQ